MFSDEQIESRVGVHRAHCCRSHGCKYGDDLCPVALGLLEQDYRCEKCPSLHQIREMGNLLAGIFDRAVTPDIDNALVQNWALIATLATGD